MAGVAGANGMVVGAGGAVVGSLSAEGLHAVLQHTFTSDATQRKAAEAQLASLCQAPECLMLLLQIVVEPQVERAVRQAAAIALKNTVRKRWSPKPEESTPATFSPEHKATFRLNIFEALLRETDSSVRDLLAETLRLVASYDFPDEWPTLIPAIVAQLQTGEVLRVHNAMLALRKIVKRFEYKPKEARGPLLDIMRVTLPLLLNMATQLLAEDSTEAGEVLKLALKVFYSCTQFAIPSGKDLEDLNVPGWMDLCAKVLAKPVVGQPEVEEDRVAFSWWKAKKWAGNIAHRFFTRYGQPLYAEEGMSDFAEAFSKQLAPKLLEQVMNTLALRPKGEYCTDRVVHACLMFVGPATELSYTYKLLKPHLDFVLFQAVFPALALSESDIETFELDPHEFIHKNNDPSEDYLSPRVPAMNCIIDLAKYRGKDILPRLLSYTQNVLTTYAATPEAQRDHRAKDAALVALGSLSTVLLRSKKYSKSLETLVLQHVLPEFQSPVGFMRYRACWMIQRFASMDVKDSQTVLHCLNAVLRCLRDSALPVQIEAASSLRFLIELDEAEEPVLQVLPDILNEYFRIMQEIGLDEVVAALDLIIEKFQDHIAPHAAALTQQLTRCFLEYASAGSDDDDACMAASQVIEAVSTVLQSTKAVPELFPAMESHLLPMIAQIFSNDGELMEYFENACDVLNFLTYYGPGISQQLWGIFPLLYNCWDKWAYDLIANMAVPIDNYVSRGTDVFVEGRTPDGRRHVELVLDMCQRVLTDERQSEKEARTAAQLTMVVLHNCKGRIDEYVPPILAMVSERVKTAEKAELKSSLLESVASALYYNPQLTLQWTEANNATQGMLTQLFVCLEAEVFDNNLGKKIVALGLTSLLSLPSASLPPAVIQVLPHAFSAVVNLVTEEVKYLAEVAEQEEGDAEENEEEEEEEEEEDEDEDGFDDDQDVRNEEDMVYMKNFHATDKDTIDDYLNGWNDEEEEEQFSTPIDDVDLRVFFYDSFRVANEREPEAMLRLQQQLKPETLKDCQQHFAEAQKQQAAAAAAAGGTMAA
ncbi:unnamed protein product [Pylaiella littoralis]